MTAAEVERGRELVESGAHVPQSNGSELCTVAHSSGDEHPDGAEVLGEPPPDDLPPDDPYTPPGDDRQGDADAPTTWEPVDLGPFLRGEVEPPEPSVGLARSDGLRLIYPGREHAVIGETESGKSWFALACVAAELAGGNTVVYVHFEESDPGSTVERLRLIGVDPAALSARLRFVAPARPVRAEWLSRLLTPSPSLVVHDGVNEGMSLHGAETKAVEGLSLFRRRLVTPFVRAGAAVLSCDHMPIGADGTRRDAYGSVHKGNVIDGSRILLESKAPMGRKLRGVSFVSVTKDRPGHLRNHGKPGSTPGKTFLGTLVVDDSQTFGPDFSLRFYAPKDDETTDVGATADLAEVIHALIVALPGQTVASRRILMAELRKDGQGFRDDDVRDALDDLTVAGRLAEVRGKRGALGYQATVINESSASGADGESPVTVTASATASHHLTTSGGTQSDAVTDDTASDRRDAVGRSRTQLTKTKRGKQQ